MFRVFRLLIAAAIGAGLGLGSVWLLLNDPRFDFSTRLGPWEVSAGAATSDPYQAARAARLGTIGLGPAEGVAFVARTDSAGNRLDPACQITVEGHMPEAGLWTLSASESSGALPVNPSARTGFASDAVISHGDGTVTVQFGPNARPGNFIQTVGLKSLILTLRAYSAGLSSRLPTSDDMPVIKTNSCQSGGAT